ncbi:two-component regulator propeller domain-containing protein [soil metagenome]
MNINLSLHEDKGGSIWFSAGGGLNRFDPNSKKIKSFLSPELTPNFGLAQDENGTFWMGSGAGLYQFDPKTGGFTSFPLDYPTNPRPYIQALLVDKEGILWIGTAGEGLFRLDTRKAGALAKPFNPAGAVNKSIALNGIIEDKSGFLWLATTEGLQQIDLQNNRVHTYRTDPAIMGSLSSNIVLSVYQDRQGTLWVGTANGINRLITYPKPFHAYQVSYSPNAMRLDENNISSVLVDREGLVWLGTSAGLYRFDPRKQHITPVPLTAGDAKAFSPANDVLQWPKIREIREDKAGRLWIGTALGVSLYNRLADSFTHYPCKIFHNTSCMALDPSGNIWIMGGHGSVGNAVLAMFDPERLQFKYTEYALNDPSGLKDMYGMSLIASRTGDLWVAAGMWGIGRMDHKTGVFRYYLPNPQSPGSMVENDVWCLYEDKKGMIWAGTLMGGLLRLNPETGVFTNYTTHDGLPSNHIKSIIEDDKGNLWLGTYKGLSCFNPTTHTFRNFDLTDGLPSNAFGLASVHSRNGKFYFGTDNGLVFFDPDSIQDNTSAPPVFITGLKVLEKKRDLPEDRMELPHHENFVSFDFAALNYHAPEKIRYAYQLEGVDQEWVQAGARRYASYTNLNPGEYVFRVKASNNDGIWEEEGATLRFLIRPPWWRTWWAYVGYTFLGVGLLYGLRQYTVNRERLKNDLKLQRLEAEKLHELDQLRSRFFANISHEFRTPLTLILGPLEKLLANPEEEGKHPLFRMMQRNAGRLLQMIHQLLDLSKLEAGSLQLDAKPGNLTQFLRTLAASFSSLAESQHIAFRAHFPQKDVLAPYDADKLEKIVVNLLANAFKFTPDGGSVSLQVDLPEEGEEKTGVLEIMVADSGIGMEQDQLEKIFDRFYQADASPTREREGTGIGLALTKELVELHKGTIEVDSQVGQGTRFLVRLPLPTVQVAEQLPEEAPLALSAIASLSGRPAAVLPAPASAQDQAPSFAQDENPHPEKPVLLIVEDNKDLSGYMAGLFQLTHQVIEAGNGEQGLQQAFATVPDLVISDVMMPVMDGITLCQKLKTDERTSHIPVILLTAKAGEESKLEGLETGADDYLTKPFRATELQLRVKNLIEGRRRLRERFSRHVILQPADVAITSADEKFLQKVLAVVEANLAEADFSAEAFERAVGMSHVQFYRKMKALTDQAPGEFLRNFRLQRAAALLTGHHGNVTEVAYAVGFNSLAYFTRCFKQFYGQSPTEYLAAQAAPAQHPQA